MFISKKDLGDLKSKAGQVAGLQAHIARVEDQLDFSPTLFWGSGIMKKLFPGMSLKPTKTLTLKTIIKSIESRLDQQEKMQEMLFTHLGIEYAKTTEETATGRQEKEVLRRARKK